MPTILPSLRGSSQQSLYPLLRTVECATGVHVLGTGAEKRWVKRPPLYSFQLTMKSLLAADKNAWVSQHSATHGRFNTDLQISVGGVTYSNLTVMSDMLPVEVARPLQYDLMVRLRQTRAAVSYIPPTVGSTYPTLSSGAVAQHPMVQTHVFFNTVEDNPTGPRFALDWYGSGFPGFPTTSLRMWRLQYPLITDADLATIETYFLGQQGRYGSFSFVDPVDGNTYTHVRFDSDTLAVRHLTTNNNSVDVLLRQTFNS